MYKIEEAIPTAFMDIEQVVELKVVGGDSEPGQTSTSWSPRWLGLQTTGNIDEGQTRGSHSYPRGGVGGDHRIYQQEHASHSRPTVDGVGHGHEW